MWADTLLGIERGYLIRLTVWAAGSVLAGSLLFAWVVVRARTVPLLQQFAVQLVAWGMLNAVIAVFAWRRLALRDYTAAMQLQHMQWLQIGLDAGCAGIGLTLAIAAWHFGPRHGGIGAGIGILVQGVVRLLLDAQLLLSIGPPR